MILKWIQSVISRPAQEPISQGTSVANEKLVDIAHGVLKPDAEDLEALLQLGIPAIRRKKLKEKVRKKVRSAIIKEFDDPDIVEEVTERIVDVAEFDPHYRRMFEE